MDDNISLPTLSDCLGHDTEESDAQVLERNNNLKCWGLESCNYAPFFRDLEIRVDNANEELNAQYLKEC